MELAAAVERAGQLLKGQPVNVAPETVAGLVAAYVASGQPRWKVRKLAEWAGDMLLAELVSLDGYGQYLVASGMKASSVRDYLYHAMVCLKWANGRGYSVAVPPMPKGLPKKTRAPRDVDPIVLRAALERIKHAKLIIRFIVATGCRPSEACGLEWDSVSVRAGTAVLGLHKTAKKTGKPRTIYLTPAALAVLAEVPTKDGPVFLSKRGRPYTPAGLRAILTRKGIPGAYCLRHTAAQTWLDDGTDFGVVAGLLGHGDLRTVQVYAQVRDPKLRRAAQQLRSPLD